MNDDYDIILQKSYGIKHLSAMSKSDRCFYRLNRQFFYTLDAKHHFCAAQKCFIHLRYDTHQISPVCIRTIKAVDSLG